ncbi:MAG: hypothetical protein ACK2T7_09815, partial [Anaerolineales bacterium]
MSRKTSLLLFICLLVLAGSACALTDYLEEWQIIRPELDMSDKLLYHGFSGRIWQDLDGDGKPDDGEDVMEGVKTILTYPDGTTQEQSGITDPMGWVEHQYDIYTYGEDQMKIDSAALEVENPLHVNPQA